MHTGPDSHVAASNVQDEPASIATPAQIRAWATAAGLNVTTKGKLPQNIRDAWQRAHPDHEAGQP